MPDDEDSYEPTRRTTLKRMPIRGVYDKETVHAILDEGWLCHIGFVVDDQPFVIPNAYARVGEKLYFHGRNNNRMLKTLRAGQNVCVTVTLVDGIVLARSGFHHSANSRSVVALGKAEAVTDPQEKLAALDAIVDHIVPGRAADLQIRPPNKIELTSTLVLSLKLEEVSAKVRAGPPSDDADDLHLPIWAGVLNMRSFVPEGGVPDAHVTDGIETPRYISDYRRPSQLHQAEP